MKRTIICKSCAGKMNPQRYPGEWIKKIDGRARHLLYCDICNRVVKQNDPCSAVSYGLNSQPYHEWESYYLKISKEF